MRIECKKCKAIYKIDSNKIPVSGKKVKCTNCNNTWTHVPTQDKIAGNSEKSYTTKESTTNPNLQHNKTTAYNLSNNSAKNYSLLRKISSIVTMMILIFSLSVTFQNNMPYKIRKIYRIIEMYDTTNIQLVDSHIKILKHDNNNIAIKVEGIIKNQSEQERFIPGIHFTLYDKHKKVIISEKLNKHKTNLIPSKQDYKFEHIIHYVPKNTDSVQIKIGNLFEIAFL
ncbi:zinc-ribbon domain-containing protein [Ehrlichia sp. JZT12]